MIQRAPARDKVAEEIVGRITAAMRPWRIVLFGSRARGGAKEDSDYDVYVEIDAANDRELIDAEFRLHSLLSDADRTIDVKVRRPGTIEQRRDDPGTIEWDVAREGIVVYADPAAATELRPSDRVREPSPEPPESFYEWLESAERNITMREDLAATGRDYSPELCWLSHQAVEKYLKALLVFRRVRPKRTHNLTKLLAAARAAGMVLVRLDADCALLTKHAIEPRYPRGMKLNENDARAAVAAAERIIAAVRAQLPPRLH